MLKLLVQVALLVAARAALAQPVPLIVDGASRCPAPPLVAATLARLLPDGVPPGREPSRIALTDEGARFRVALLGREKVFADPARRCAERARGAAVFAALVLRAAAPLPEAVVEAEPPDPDLPVAQIGDAEDPFAAPRAPRPAHANLAARKKITARADLELLGQLDGAPAGDSAAPLISAGGAARACAGIAFGRGFFGGELGVAGRSPARLVLPAATARVERVPFELGARVSFRAGRLEIGGVLGLSLAVLLIAGENLPVTRDSTRVELGVRLAGFLRVWLSRRVAALLTVDADVVPHPHELSVAPTGVVGRLPSAWIAGGAGLAVRLH